MFISGCYRYKSYVIISTSTASLFRNLSFSDAYIIYTLINKTVPFIERVFLTVKVGEKEGGKEGGREEGERSKQVLACPLDWCTHFNSGDWLLDNP